MAEGTSGDELSPRDWMIEQVAGEEPELSVSAQRHTGEDNGAEQPTGAVDDHDGRDMLDEGLLQRDLGFGRERPHELDAPVGENPSEASGRDVNFGARRAAV